jgi:hypothetical protein
MILLPTELGINIVGNIKHCFSSCIVNLILKKNGTQISNMLTRQQAQDTLTQVLQVLLGFTDTDPLPLALVHSGYTDIHHIITMTQDDINALEYEDSNKGLVGMPSPAWNLLRIFNAYHVYRYEEGDPIGDDWVTITPQEFNEFHVDVNTIIINPLPTGYAR